MKTAWILWMAAAAVLGVVGYGLPRANFSLFIACYGALFLCYGYWMHWTPKTASSRYWAYAFGAAMGLRAILLFALPELSDDFWRYLWDGRLLTYGVNPYAYTPAELVGTGIFEQAHLHQLYPQLNSPDFYSVYPPVTQAIFAFSTFLFPSNVWASVVVLHLCVLLLEAGTIYGLIKLLKALGRSPYWAFVYGFNPLIVLELSGNLHTESILACCLVWMAYAWVKQCYVWSALALGLAVGAKIIPLMLLPLLLRRLWFWKGVAYCMMVVGIAVGLVALFYDWALLQQTRESMGLYFQHFEFNGSVYYYFRYVLLHEYWHLWEYHDYFMHVTWVEDALRLDWYHLLRKGLPLATVGSIVWLSLRHPSTGKIWTVAMWCFTAHLLLSTTVHPWYLTPIILLSVLTDYRFPLLWSGLIGLTYISYQGGGFAEQAWVMVVEYGVLFAFVLYEQKAWRCTTPTIIPTWPPHSFGKIEQKHPSGNFIP